eukprot:757160-Hanusia_phi.AAC.3
MWVGRNKRWTAGAGARYQRRVVGWSKIRVVVVDRGERYGQSGVAMREAGKTRSRRGGGVIRREGWDRGEEGVQRQGKLGVDVQALDEGKAGVQRVVGAMYVARPEDQGRGRYPYPVQNLTGKNKTPTLSTTTHHLPVDLRLSPGTCGSSLPPPIDLKDPVHVTTCPQQVLVRGLGKTRGTTGEEGVGTRRSQGGYEGSAMPAVRFERPIGHVPQSRPTSGPLGHVTSSCSSWIHPPHSHHPAGPPGLRLRHPSQVTPVLSSSDIM